MSSGKTIEQLQHHINCQQLVINDLTADLYKLQENTKKLEIELDKYKPSLYQPSYGDSFKTANATTGFSILDDNFIKSNN